MTGPLSDPAAAVGRADPAFWDGDPWCYLLRTVAPPVVDFSDGVPTGLGSSVAVQLPGPGDGFAQVAVRGQADVVRSNGRVESKSRLEALCRCGGAHKSPLCHVQSASTLTIAVRHRSETKHTSTK